MLKKVDVAILIITLGAVLWAAGLIAWNYWRADESARLMGCRQNLVRLAEAAARLRSQQGRSPQNLQELGPHLPGGMRPCPSSGTLTYAMVTGREGAAGFTIFCSGRNHGFLDIPEGFPQYSSAGDCVYYRPNEGLRLEPPSTPGPP